MQPAKIQDYGIVGDCRSAALVSRQGSIDWLCWPRFDSPSIFGALLDTMRGGYWKISPRAPFQTERSYLGESNVLETRFRTSTGKVRLVDFMPVATEEFKRQSLVPDHELLRKVDCTAGELLVEFDFRPRLFYGLEPSNFLEGRELGLRIQSGRGVYCLRSTTELEVKDNAVHGEFRLRAGDSLCFSLTYSEESPMVLPFLQAGPNPHLDRSLQWWNRWAAKCMYQGVYREIVIRSALLLKLLTYAPSGAIIAAPTTSLPERLRADLNWDYRYCWLRDAAFTIRALLGLGFREEAESFVEWMLHATRLTQPQLNILYTVFGENAPKERELSHLEGYYGSRPVRIGNGARSQLQMDVYGEVIDAAAHYAAYGGRFDRASQKVLIGFGRYVARNWNQPDEGIWEPRSGRRHNTHSRLLCWTALDRLLGLAERGILQGVPTDLFERERKRIAEQISKRAWNEESQSYSSVFDAEEVDATLLLLSWYGFERADSPRLKSTYDLLSSRLGAGHSLLYRYLQNPPEGAFGICSFWNVEYLAQGGGTLEQAHAAFQRLLAYRNDLGLYAEEIDPENGDALGNFPQAFTHVGLISAALSLQERETGTQRLNHRKRSAIAEEDAALR